MTQGHSLCLLSTVMAVRGLVELCCIWSDAIMQRLRRLGLALGVLAAITYVGDYLAVRVRIAWHRSPFDTMEIQRLHAIRLKSGRYDITLDEPEMQTCVHALFPHLGSVPCWYLARHTRQRIIHD
jgi:hypothetical protein